MTIIEHDGKRYEILRWSGRSRGDTYLSPSGVWVASNDYHSSPTFPILRELPPDDPQPEPEVRFRWTGERRGYKAGEWYIGDDLRPTVAERDCLLGEQRVWILERVEVASQQPKHPLPWRASMRCQKAEVIDAEGRFVFTANDFSAATNAVAAANELSGVSND